MVWLQFYLVWSVANTSFPNCVQNSFGKCWTCHHWFLQYMSSFWNVPGSGTSTLVFKLRSYTGLHGIILLTSPMDSQAIDWELVILSTSTNNVRRDSSLRLSPRFLSMTERILLAYQICRSHTPPMLLAMGGLCWNHEITDPFLVHFAKWLPQLNACINRVGPIVTSSHPNISSSTV